MFKFFLLLFIGFQCIVGNTKAQTKFYVNTNGNDGNPGTLAKPFKSVNKSLEAAKDKSGTVTIYLRKGTYYLDTTLVIDAKGFKPTSLNLTNYQDEAAIISAGKKLQLDWRPYKKGIYQAKVATAASFEQLFINGIKQVPARYPNYDSTARILQGTSPEVVSEQRIKRWKDPDGGYLHGLQAYQWGSLDYKITGKNPDGSLKLEGGWQNNRPSTLHKAYRYVDHIFEELDTSGEWFFDKKQHMLYFYPPKQLNLKTATVISSQLKNSIVLKGTSDQPLIGVHIKGISFVHNAATFMDTREPLLRSDWRIYRGGALLLEGTDHCSIEDCRFYNMGGNAVMVSGYNNRAAIKGSHFYQIGASAICFIGNEGAVRSPINNYNGFISYDNLDKVPGPLSNDYPVNCIADNNLIHDIGLMEKQVAGVDINIAADIHVSHNTIYNVPRAGINIGDGCFGGHVIEYNCVFNTVLETGDHGAFNSWGRDRFWNADRSYMDSLVAIHPELILLDVQKKIVLRYNYFSCDHGWDIDLDDGSSNYEIYNNICLSGGMKFREGFYRKGYNNIILNNTFHPHVWFKNSHDVFEHNIVMEAYKPIRVNGWGDTVDYNLFLTKSDLKVAQKNGTDLHSTYGHPDFLDPQNGIYTVGAQSAALKMGFKNFSMSNTGVQIPALKKLADRPVFPKLKLGNSKTDHSQVFYFQGAGLKSITGLGDKSAYGLPDEKGVVILMFKAEGIFSQAGFKISDVIRKWAGTRIKNLPQLMDLMLPFLHTGKTVTVQIIRDQQPLELRLNFKK